MLPQDAFHFNSLTAEHRRFRMALELIGSINTTDEANGNPRNAEQALDNAIRVARSAIRSREIAA